MDKSFFDNLYLYGSGERADFLLQVMEEFKILPAGVVDSNRNKWGSSIHGIVIQSPDILRGDDQTAVCVTFYSENIYEPIWDRLITEYGINKSQLYSYNEIILMLYESVDVNIAAGNYAKNYKALFDGSWGLALGGVETWLKSIIELFYYRDDVELITPTGGYDLSEQVIKHSINKQFENPPVFLQDNVNDGVDFIKKYLPCTIVLSKPGILLLAASLVKRVFPDMIKIIMVIHGYCDGVMRDDLSFKKYVDEYICVNTGAVNHLIDCGIPKRKVHLMLIPVGMPKEYHRYYQTDYSKPIRIGYGGRLEIKAKRVDLLLKLITELEVKGINYYFSIAGSGSLLNTIQKFVSNRHLNNRVHIYGQLNHNDMYDFWQNQDVFVNISDNEGRPISNIEAMINGAVPVVTDTYGSIEDVSDNINGLVVPIGDYKTMADKISFLNDNRSEIAGLGIAAREYMIKKNDINFYKNQWQKLLDLS